MSDAQAAGIAAAAASLLALLALLFCLVLARRLRALRAAQRVILGEAGERDLISHASALDLRLGDLAAAVEETVGRLDASDAELSRRLEGAVSHCAVVRYDAMNEMSGQQSSSVALLDSHRCGVVLSSILHREQARLYAKQIIDGVPVVELSPEEQEAVSSALRPPEPEGGSGR